MPVTFKNVVGHVWNYLIGRESSQPSTSKSQQLILSAMPIGGAAKASSSIIKGISSLSNRGITGIKNSVAATKALLTGGAKNAATKILAGVGTGAAVGASYDIARATAAGEKVNFNTVLHGATLGLAGGVSKVGAIAGTGTGTVQGMLNKIFPPTSSTGFQEKVYNATQSVADSITRTDMKNMFDSFNQSISNGLSGMQIPQTPIMYLETPQVPNYGGGGFNVSMPSTGIGENLPLLMLLLAGGAGFAGYKIGKRKKKKYKKRERRK